MRRSAGSRDGRWPCGSALCSTWPANVRPGRSRDPPEPLADGPRRQERPGKRPGIEEGPSAPSLSEKRRDQSNDLGGEHRGPQDDPNPPGNPRRSACREPPEAEPEPQPVIDRLSERNLSTMDHSGARELAAPASEAGGDLRFVNVSGAETSPADREVVPGQPRRVAWPGGIRQERGIFAEEHGPIDDPRFFSMPDRPRGGEGRRVPERLDPGIGPARPDVAGILGERHDVGRREFQPEAAKAVGVVASPADDGPGPRDRSAVGQAAADRDDHFHSRRGSSNRLDGSPGGVGRFGRGDDHGQRGRSPGHSTFARLEPGPIR